MRLEQGGKSSSCPQLTKACDGVRDHCTVIRTATLCVSGSPHKTATACTCVWGDVYIYVYRHAWCNCRNSP